MLVIRCRSTGTFHRTFARGAVLCGLVALAAAGFSGSAAADLRPKQPRPTTTPFDPTTILVKFKEPSAGATTVQAAGDRPLGLIPGARVEVVKLQAGETVARKLAEYRSRSDVVFAEPNYVLKPDSLPPLTPNDPMLGSEWGLTNIHAPAGWAIYPGTFSSLDGVKIAIVDTGIYADHPDLSGKVLVDQGAGCLGSGFICSSAYSSRDDLGHGTHVAGIAGAVTDNGTGVAGLAVSSPLVPIKVCFGTVVGDGCPVASVASGIAWAVAKGAKVINLSLGGPGSTLCAATAAAIAKGVTVVAAAGNSASNVPTYPAACAGVIGVAANGNDGDTAWYGNWDYPDAFVSAPGGNDFDEPPPPGYADTEILSTVPFNLEDGSPGLYESIQGTSMASPFVAGLAALMVSERPLRKPADVRRALAKTAEKVLSPIYGDYGVPYGGYAPRGPDPFHVCAAGECTWHPFWGYGQIDVSSALTGAPPKVLSFTPAIGTVGTAVTINGEDLAAATEVAFGPGPNPGASGTGRTGTLLATPSENSIRVAVPAGAVTGHISVTTPGGTSDSAAIFKVAPKVTGFEPASARRLVDTVTVHGRNFTGATLVKVGALVVPGFAFVDDETLTLTLPATAVTGKISVTTPSGVGVSAASLVVVLPPKISGFLPGSGPVGTTVTVTGSSLDSVTSGTLNGLDVGSITHVSASSLKFTVQDGSSTGKIALTNTAGTATSVADFKVAPKVTGFDPASAKRGDAVTVHGKNFIGATAVKVGTVAAASFTVVDDSTITFTVAGTAVTGKITVTTPAGTATSTASLVVILPPAISSFTPASGPVGTTVTVNGTHLDSVTSATLNGVDVGAITHVSAASLRLVVPSGASTGKIALTNTAGTATSVADFKVAPKVTGFDPASAKRGDTVTLHGKNFTGTTSVKVGVVVVPGFSVVDDETLTLTVPATAVTGKISVSTPSGVGVSATSLVVVLPPTISGFSPGSGPVGTTVTVTGSSLDSVTAGTVNGSDVGAITHVSASSVRFVVPDGAATGKIALSNTAGTATSLADFKVAPKVTGFEPGSARRLLDTVTVHGKNFTGATSVKVGAVVAAGFSVVDDSTISFTVGATAVSGKISVTTPSGVGLSATSLLVVLPPTISSFSPTSGPVGTTVTVTGTNLDSVNAATLNGVDTGTITHVAATSIRIAVPAGAASTGKITVTNPAGTATSAGSFTVPLLITGFAPASGASGTVVTISGSGLSTAALVEFNGTPTLPLSAGPTLVTAAVPPLATDGPIRVTTSTGQSATSLSSFGVTSISGVSPGLGAAGSTVTINGTRFAGATGVSFNGTPASFTVDSNTQITATVPADATDGPIGVEVGGGEALSPDSFSVVAITDFSPQSGMAGTPLTISGTHLGSATAVKVGTGAVGSFLVDPTGTQITTTVPNAATNGRITVETPYGTAVSPGDDFYGTFHVVPTITSFSPMIGTPGTTVSVGGTGLRSVGAVTFGDAYADPATITVNAGGTLLTVSAPEGSGQIGLHTGLTDGYSAQSFTLFWIRSAYRLPGGDHIVNPGDSVFIDGANLQNATSIKFHGVEAASFSYGGDGRITAVVPAGFTTGPLSITTPLGTTTSSFDLVRLEITGFNPTSGPAGTSVTVTGVGFQDPAMTINFLSFFGRIASQFTIDSDSQITVTVPVDAFTGPIQIFTTQGVTQSVNSFTVTP